MATQVNKKVVAGIVVGIVGLCLLVVLAGVYFAQKSPTKNINRGDVAFGAGDYELAATQYSRAVNKEPTNIEYIDKWRDALVRVIPESDADYQEAYELYLGGVLESKSRQRPGMGEFQIAYVNEFIRRAQSAGARNAASMDAIVEQVEGRARGLNEDDPYRTRVLRWRGFALTGKAQVTNLTDEEYATAIGDLSAAYELDTDVRALVDLYELHDAVRRRAEADRQAQRAEEASSQADEVLARLQDEHASHPLVIATSLFVERAAASEMPREMAIDAMRDAGVEAASAFAAIDVKEYSVDVLLQAAILISRMAPNEANDDIDSVLERKLEEFPASSRLMMQRAQLALSENDADRAFDLFQEVIDTPNQPISLDGLRLLGNRRLALYNQGRLRIKEAEFAGRADKGALIEEAQGLLEELRERVLANEETLAQKLEAQITLQRALIAENQAEKLALLKEADQMLTQLETTSPAFARDPDVLVGSVLALLEQRLPGEAREKLVQLDAVTGGAQTAQTLLYWALVEQQLNNIESSLDYYQRLADMLPDNQFVLSNIARLGAAAGVEPADGADPVLLAINRSRDLRAEGDLPGALAILETVYEENPERLDVLRFIVSLDLSMENRELAGDRLRVALEREPGNALLQNLLTRVEVLDPVEAQLQIIADSDQSELSKALQRESVYRGAMRSAEADEQLSIAIGLAPDDPVVIDRRFVRALMRGEDGIADAEAAAESAASINLDGHDGDIYRSRVAIVKGDTERAIEILTGITESNPRDADAWRWLGGAQRAAGLVDAAVESYARAYRARPSDVGYAGDYANALVAAGRGTEAAAVLSPETGLLSFGSAGDQMVERWLQLEGRYGNRERVKTMREQSFSRDPSRIVNAISYLQLLIQDEEFERAQEVIDVYASSRNPRALRVAQMTAALRAKQGRFDEAVTVLNTFIDETPEGELTDEPFRILARLYEENGDLVNAAETFRRGRPYQGERLTLDRSLADLRFRYASRLRSDAVVMNPEDPNFAVTTELHQAGYREAMDVYQNIVDAAGYDELIMKRIAECQLRLKLYTQLDETLDTIVRESGNENDLQVLMLRAVSAEDQGDRQALDSYLDRSVEFNSSNPLAYYRRAQVNSQIPERRPDVIADLEEAVKLRPGYVDAWALLARNYALMGEPDQAFQKLRSAIETNPNDERLPRVLVDLYEALRQLDQAFNAATQYASEDEEDLYWVDRAARLAQLTRNFDAAYRWLTIQDELTEFKDERIALDRLNSMLRRESRTDIPEVNRLMRRIDEMNPVDDAAIVVNLLKARAEAARGNRQKSDQLFIETHDLARDRGPVALRLIVESLFFRGLQEKSAEGAQEEMLKFLRDTRALQPLHPYLKLELIQPNVFAAQGRDQQEQVNAVLEAVGAEIDPEDNISLFRFNRLASNLRYTLEDYAGSVEASQAALEIAPNNPEMANNLAYTLSTHLGRHEEALEFAQRAAQINPNASYILDTLGVIQLRTGNVDQALLTLDRAIATAVGPDNLSAALLHKAEALLEADRTNEARQTAVRAQSAMRGASSQTQTLYADDLRALIERMQ